MGRVIFIMARPICVLRSLSLSPAIRSGLMGGLALRLVGCRRMLRFGRLSDGLR